MGNAATNNDCPLWFLPGDNGSCVCGEDLGGIVKCNNESREAYLLEWFCMSQDSTGLVVGACPFHYYSCISVQREYCQVHYLLPKNISDLEDFICGHLNRKGRMCGQCRDGFTTSAYSYDMRCVKCSGGHYNWAKYVAVTLLPSTAFFIVVVTFRISVTLPPMVALVHILQLIMAPTSITHQVDSTTTNSTNSRTHCLYHLWNLESRLLSNSHSTRRSLPGNVNNTHPSLGLPSCILPSHPHCDYIYFD